MSGISEKQKQEFLLEDDKKKVICLDNDKNRYQFKVNKTRPMEEILSKKYDKKIYSYGNYLGKSSTEEGVKADTMNTQCNEVNIQIKLQ